MEKDNRKFKLLPIKIFKIIKTGKYPFNTTKWEDPITYRVFTDKDELYKANTNSSLLDKKYISFGNTSWGDIIAYDVEARKIVIIDHELLLSKNSKHTITDEWNSSKEFLAYINNENMPKQKKYKSDFLNNVLEPNTLKFNIMIWSFAIIAIGILALFIYILIKI